MPPPARRQYGGGSPVYVPAAVAAAPYPGGQAGAYNAITGFSDLARVLLAIQAQKRLEEESQSRQLLGAEKFLQDQAKFNADRARAIYEGAIEQTAGTKATPEIDQFMGQAAALAAPGARITRPIGSPQQIQVPRVGPGGEVTEPPTGPPLISGFATSQDVLGAARQGAQRMQAETRRRTELLPESRAKTAMLQDLLGGTTFPPSEVEKRFGAMTKAEADTQALQEAQALQAPKVRQEQARATSTEVAAEVASKTALPTAQAAQRRAEAEATRVELENPFIEAHRTAQIMGQELENRQKQFALTGRGASPGSPLALQAEQTKEQIATSQLTRQKMEFDLTQQRGYASAMERWRASGGLDNIALNDALSWTIGGAAKLLDIPFEQAKFLALNADNVMRARSELQAALNKGNVTIDQMAPQIATLNQMEYGLAKGSGSTTTQLTSLIATPGWFGTSPTLSASSASVPLNVAENYLRGAYTPDNVVGLTALMRIKYGSITDPTILKKKAAEWPGATMEAIQGFQQFVDNMPGATGVPTQTPSAPAEAPATQPLRAPQIRGFGTLSGGPPEGAIEPSGRLPATLEDVRKKAGEVRAALDPYKGLYEAYDAHAVRRYRKPFVQLSPSERQQVINEVNRGK